MRHAEEISSTIREIAYAIHLYFGHGHLEKVYENALVNRIRKAGYSAQQQFPISVYDEDGTSVGEYFADLLVEDCLIIELKACQRLVNEHIAQLLGYLKTTQIKDGLLINFGSYQFQLRKFVMD